MHPPRITYTYTPTHPPRHTQTHTNAHTFIHVHDHTNTLTHTHIHTYTHSHTDTHTCTYTKVHTYNDTVMHTRRDMLCNLHGFLKHMCTQTLTYRDSNGNDVQDVCHRSTCFDSNVELEPRNCWMGKDGVKWSGGRDAHTHTNTHT